MKTCVRNASHNHLRECFFTVFCRNIQRFLNIRGAVCPLSHREKLCSELHCVGFIIEFPAMRPAEKVGCKTSFEAETTHVDFSLALSDSPLLYLASAPLSVPGHFLSLGMVTV